MTETPSLLIEPPTFLTERRLAPVLAALPGTRVVGGAVRDTLAGLPVADVDLAAPQPPEEVMRRLAEAGFRTIPTGLVHGTVTVITDGHSVEITTLRRDLETDGRHAVVAFTNDWQADAARRDFTINAMSMTGGGAVFDYFGGIADLHAGRLRFVGDPAARIAEDHLRVLRFFRFYARYAGQRPDVATQSALRDGAKGLRRLSAERVWSELKRILASDDPSDSVTLMAELGVLQAALPEAANSAPIPLSLQEGSGEGSKLNAAGLTRLIHAGAPADPILRLAALLPAQPPPPLAGGGWGRGSHDTRRPDEPALTAAGVIPTSAAKAAERLRLSKEEQERLLALTSGPVPGPRDDDAALRRLLADHDKQTLIGRTWIEGGAGSGWQDLRARLEATPVPVFPLLGRDVLALGLSPGPLVGRFLEQVRTWWLAGGCAASRTECLAELSRLVSAEAPSQHRSATSAPRPGTTS